MRSLVKKLIITLLVFTCTVLSVQAVIGPVGPEVLVNTNNINQAQPLAEMAMAANGNFVVVWYDVDFVPGSLYARLYDALGNPLTAPIQVTFSNLTHSVSTTHVAMNDAGNFVVAYTLTDTLSSDSDIYMRVYDPNGVVLTSEILVNNSIAGVQYNPEVAIAGNGNIVVVWHSENPGVELRARMFDPTGAALVGDFQVDTSPSGQLFADVAMDATGNFVVVWDEYGPDGDLGGILARQYNNAGVPLGAEFIVNTVTANSQYRPSITMNSTGDFIIVWTSDGQDPDGSSGVYARRFNNAGAALGVEFNVATDYAGTQTGVDVTLDDSGNFVALWTNSDPGPTQGAYVHRYDAAGLSLENQILVSPLVSGEPSIAMLSPLQFVVAYSALNHPSGNYIDVFFQRFGDVPPTPPTSTPPVVASASTSSQSLSLFDPSISKIGFLTPGQLGVTGEQLEWVITITNNGSAAGTNVVISDTLRSELRIDRVQTSKGTSNINGQTVTINIPSLAPNESVQISVFTTVLRGVNIDNTACVRADNLSNQRCATGLAVRSLPSTGEIPFARIGWWMLLISLLSVGVIWKRRFNENL